MVDKVAPLPAVAVLLVGGRDRVGPDDGRVEDRHHRGAGEARGLGVGADRLRALALVDAERPDLAALLGERVAADPADARARFVADFRRALAGDFEVFWGPPAVTPKDSVELHFNASCFA